MLADPSYELSTPRHASPMLVGAGDRLRPSSPYWSFPHDVHTVEVANQILVFRDCQYPKPQCVAIRRGKRCRGVARGDEFACTEGKIHIAGADTYVRVTSADDEEIYLRQRCPDCLKSPEPDAVSPEWTVFDADRDADLLEPTRRTWTPDGIVTRFRPPDSTSAVERPVSATLADLLASIPPAVVAPLDTTALYRWWDAGDLLLYVGITDDLPRRSDGHSKGSSWMDFAARSEITRYPSRQEAAAAEVAAIKAERPLFNHQHNATPEAQLRLVEYLVQHERADLLMPAVSRG